MKHLICLRSVASGNECKYELKKGSFQESFQLDETDILLQYALDSNGITAEIRIIKGDLPAFVAVLENTV